MPVGYWNLSRTQVLDQNDNLIPGALARFYEAGITTPMTVFSSASMGEVNEHSQPVVADGNARWPQVFFNAAFLYYDVVVTDADGVQLFADQSVPIIGQATTPGPGDPVPIPVDQTGIAKTGDVKLKFGNAPETGWVRCNGGTISNGGPSASGTERADADCEDLYLFLYANDNIICPVVGGRTTAAADFASGRGITLPDMRHRAPFGLGIMGNAALPTPRIADAFIDTAIAGATDVVGVVGGDDDIALTTAQMPAHSHGSDGVLAEAGPPIVAAKAGLQAINHGHPMRINNVDGQEGSVTNAGGFNISNPAGVANYPAFTGGVSGSGAMDATIGHQIGGSGLVDITGFTSLAGGPAAALTGVSDRHENMPPFMFFTYLIKL